MLVSNSLMAATTFLILFLLSHLLFLLSAQDQTTLPGCPTFQCGKLGNISFPFSNTTQLGCGLCAVDCSTHETPKIQLGNEWYDVNIISMANFMEIQDVVLQQRLKSQPCDSFNNNFTLPHSTPSISFTPLNNYTFFKCTKSSDEQAAKYFPGHNSYKNCSGFSVYYSHPQDYQSDVIASLPPNCGVIQLPVLKSPHQIQNFDNPFKGVLTSNVRLRWQLSSDCSDCHNQKGKCQINKDNEFVCANKERKTHYKVILGTVIPGGFILLGLVIVIFWRRKKLGYVSSYLLSRNTSSDPSSTADLEGGSVYFGVPVFSYSELEEATNNFDPTKELGDGGFGTVYFGKLRDGREVAVKRLYEHNYKRVEQFRNEIEILTRLRHQNLVLLYGCTSRHSRELLLVYEYIPNGTVADHLHGDRAETGSLTWPIRMNIAIETASALVYLHASDIIHRDVKTNNILLDNNFCVKVADFGLSRLFPNDVSHISTAPQGTPGYVDPEYYQCYQLTDKSDVYSFGVVLVELISSMPAVDITRHRHEINLATLAINRIQKSAFNELIDSSLGFESNAKVERMTTSVAELAFRCLQLEKEMRPTMEEILETLKDIRGEEYKNEMTGDDNVLKNIRPPPPSAVSEEDVSLKKATLPSSPDSVTDKWVISRSTTPSTSG